MGYYWNKFLREKSKMESIMSALKHSQSFCYVTITSAVAAGTIDLILCAMLRSKCFICSLPTNFVR